MPKDIVLSCKTLSSSQQKSTTFWPSSPLAIMLYASDFLNKPSIEVLAETSDRKLDWLKND